MRAAANTRNAGTAPNLGTAAVPRRLFPLLVFLSCLFLAAPAAAAEPYRLQLTPNPILVGERGSLTFVTAGDEVRLAQLPQLDGWQWLSNAPSVASTMQIVNMQRYSQVTSTYFFRVLRPGEYTLPALELRIGGQSYRTAPLKLLAQERTVNVDGQAATLDKLVYLRLTYNGQPQPPPYLYPGQPLTIQARLYVHASVQIARDFFNADSFFPEPQVDNGVFAEVQLRQGLKSRFDYQDSNELVDGQRFRVFTYTGRLTAIVPGRLEGRLRHAVPLLSGAAPDRDPFDQFMLMPRPRETYTQDASASLVGIEVRPLPAPAPGDGTFLGLLGTWELALTLDKERAKVGDDANLRLQIKGSGPLGPLNPPKFDFEGFNLYDPRVETGAGNENQATVTWALVPRRTGAQLPELRFCTFDPDRGQYVSRSFTPRLEVLPGNNETAAAPAHPADFSPPAGTAPAPPRAQVPDILYLHRDMAPAVAAPLWHNRLGLLGLLLIAGPVAFALAWWRQWRLAARGGDEAAQRRQAARARRGDILRAVAEAGPAELPAVIRDQVMPWLADLHRLPPGADTATVLAALADEEWREVLRRAEACRFMPGSELRVDPRHLQRWLGRLGALVCVGWALAAAAGEDPAAAYDRGQFQAAAESYAQQLAPQPGYGSPTLYYNLGNCAFAAGDYGRALWRYEQARRLDPRDSDLRENLEATRSRLGLPRLGQDAGAGAFLVAWRDRLRPDEWLLLAAGAWLAAWGLAAWRRWQGRGAASPWLVLPLLAALLALTALVTQRQSTWAPQQALVLERGAPLRALPGTEAAVRDRVGVGTIVRVVEARSDFSLVRLGEREGWLPNRALGPLLSK